MKAAWLGFALGGMSGPLGSPGPLTGRPPRLPRTARLAGAIQVAVDGALEPAPRSPLLLALPERLETIEEQPAAGLQVDRVHVEAAVGRPVMSLRGQPRIQIGRVTGLRPDALGVGSLQLLEVPLDAREHHGAIVDLTEDVLQVARAAPRRVGRLAEGEPGRLQHVAEPLGGDAHVVLRFRLAVE